MVAQSIIDKLSQYDQLHLLKFYDDLTASQQEHLLSQIERIDFSLLDLLQNRQAKSVKGKLAPLNALTIAEIAANKEVYRELGLTAIRQHQVAAILLAGGQGTRLGFEKPKGMLNVGIDRTLYLFQLLIGNLLEVVQEAAAWLPLYIMTSEKNHQDTMEFLAEQNYFGYQKEYVFFFQQEMAPSVAYDGKIYLEKPDEISLSPNGNGGWFTSLQKAGLVRQMKQQGVKWLNIFSVDNPLQRIADPVFIGATVQQQCFCAAKVVKKTEPQEHVGVLCLEDDKPSIVEYYELTEELIHSRDAKGDLLYNWGVILNYLFQLEKLEAISDQQLPLHIVEKKIPYLDENGICIEPKQPNGYKFELLVLDMIHLMENCLSFEVEREKEFAPIKNPTGVDSLESARKLLQQNGIEL
ncbi:MAG: UDPGP type 1 family protein [Negativicutes bacterium]|nr:UDPGP type 1 family protein [Negativicutes bacterium]